MTNKTYNSTTIERLRYLSLPKQRTTFEIRSYVFQKVRQFLYQRDFLEVHLPSIVSVPTDPVKDPTKELFKLNYYGQDSYLIQSVQLHKQMLMAAGFSKIYSLAQFWRDNEIVTPRHSVESWGLDVEIAYIQDENEIMVILEDIINYVLTATVEKYHKIIKPLNITYPLLRLTYDEAIRILQEHNIDITWGEDPGYEREKKLGEIMSSQGVNIFFVTQYPSVVKKFYTKLKKDDKYTATFDLIFDGWEIASGAQRETNIDILTRRIIEKKLNVHDYDDFLDIFRLGAPDHAGFCLGIDRFICKLLKLNSVEDSILFPRNPGKLHP